MYGWVDNKAMYHYDTNLIAALFIDHQIHFINDDSLKPTANIITYANIRKFCVQAKNAFP